MKKMKFFAFDRENGCYDFFETEAEAIKCAEDTLESYRSEASQDGWPEQMTGMIGYGEIKVQVGAEIIIDEKKNYTPEELADDQWAYSDDFDKVVDFELEAEKEA